MMRTRGAVAEKAPFVEILHARDQRARSPAIKGDAAALATAPMALLGSGSWDLFDHESSPR